MQAVDSLPERLHRHASTELPSSRQLVLDFTARDRVLLFTAAAVQQDTLLLLQTAPASLRQQAVTLQIWHVRQQVACKAQ